MIDLGSPMEIRGFLVVLHLLQLSHHFYFLFFVSLLVLQELFWLPLAALLPLERLVAGFIRFESAAIESSLLLLHFEVQDSVSLFLLQLR